MEDFIYRWMVSTGRSDVNLTDFEIDLMACSSVVFVSGRSVGGEFGHIVARLSSWIENQFCHWQDLGVLAWDFPCQWHTLRVKDAMRYCVVEDW